MTIDAVLSEFVHLQSAHFGLLLALATPVPHSLFNHRIRQIIFPTWIRRKMRGE